MTSRAMLDAGSVSIALKIASALRSLLFRAEYFYMYTESYSWRSQCRVIRDNAIAWEVDLGQTLSRPLQGRPQDSESAAGARLWLSSLR